MSYNFSKGFEMKIVKILLTTLASIIIIVLVAAAVLPDQYALEREVSINQSSDKVFNYIKFIKNMDDYSVWAKIDPDMKQTYSGTDGKVGFIAVWESGHEHVGKGEQEIKKIVDGISIETELRFIEPFEATDQAILKTDAISDTQTKVTWSFSGNMPYPMNLMLVMIDMEKELGVPLAKGLENLKAIMEKKQ